MAVPPWKIKFKHGVLSFRDSRLEEALGLFNEAIQLGGDNQHIVYDSRAAVFERMEKQKEALRDAKKVIDMAPDRWQGYYRSARLFHNLERYDASIKMAELALTKIKPDDTKRRDEIKLLQETVIAAQREVDARWKRTQCYCKKLPIEMFGEIFSLVVALDSAQLLTVLHVCTSWRNMAWGNPKLWEKLVLVSRNPVRKLKLWMERSRRRIRQLHISSDVVSHPDWPPPQLRKLDWQHLRVCKIGSWDLAKYLSSISTSHILPRLTDIHITDDPNKKCNRDSLFPAGMALRYLTLENADFSWATLASSVTRLSSFAGIGVPIHDDILTFLESNPALEYLSLDPSPTSQRLESRQPVHLPLLTHLDANTPFSFSRYLECLEVPALQTLSLRQCVLANLANLTRSPHLTTMRLSGCAVSPTALIEILRTSPQLQTLELTGSMNVANQVLEALATVTTATAEDEAGPPTKMLLCPSLEYVDFSMCPDVSTGPLIRLVKSRLPSLVVNVPSKEATDDGPVQRIVSIVVNECPKVDVEWHPWFKENVDSFTCIYMPKRGPRWRR